VLADRQAGRVEVVALHLYAVGHRLQRIDQVEARVMHRVRHLVEHVGGVAEGRGRVADILDGVGKIEVEALHHRRSDGEVVHFEIYRHGLDSLAIAGATSS
jgi:hypothetical protein